MPRKQIRSGQISCNSVRNEAVCCVMETNVIYTCGKEDGL